MSSLYSYFRKEAPLPNPNGPLSLSIPSSSINSANKLVSALLDQSASGKTRKARGEYNVFTPEEKARIAKCAVEIGVTCAIRRLSKQFTDCSLKESSVRTWTKQYIKELERNKMSGMPHKTPTKLETKKRGRPLLLGEELDGQVKMYITALRSNGAVINSAIVMACAEGLVKSHDSNLLQCNGGHIVFTKFWAQSLLLRMGSVKRRATTKAKVSVTNFDKIKAQFLFDIKTIMEMEDIPKDLVINWDHTGLHYVPVSNWTMAKEGSKRVEIVGIEDKRQITAVFGGTMTGDFLPPQIIYQGKTPKCLPKVVFPESWHVTFTQNHWANEKTTIDYLNMILLPYIEEKRKALSVTAPALVIFDRFKGQCTEAVLSLLEKNNILMAVVPGNCTNRLQPLDISANKPAKELLRGKFQTWYSDQICQTMKEGVAEKSIDLKMSIVKPLGAQWLIELYNYMKSKPEIIVNGFHGSGITL